MEPPPCSSMKMGRRRKCFGGQTDLRWWPAGTASSGWGLILPSKCVYRRMLTKLSSNSKQPKLRKGGVLMIVFNLIHLLLDIFLTVYIEQHAAQSILINAMN